MVVCKTKNEIEQMRRAGQVVGRTLEELAKNVRPGVSALELDRIADDFIRSQGCTAAFFKLYGFPEHICISFNEEVVHGIPSRRVLKEGDIISFDVGAIYQGWNGDAAMTFAVGQVSAQATQLLRVTQEAMMLGIEQMRLGHHLNDIGAAIQAHVDQYGYSIVRDWGGHGIGRKLHEDPHVMHYRQPTSGMGLRKGMCLAVEPLVNVGGPEVLVRPDKWTVVTKDGQLSAHFEHSIAITDGDPYILTMG